jgi:cold shock CspA family protein
MVAAFDEAAGYGTVRDVDGRDWWFHCTAISGGTRQIDRGAAVVCRVVPGRQGRWECVDVVAI